MALSMHRARLKYAAALLSPSCRHKLPSVQRVPAEFAARLGGDGGLVLLVSPFGKVWRTALRHEGGGNRGAWQLVEGWPEFVAAHGVAAGWSVVFRLECAGVATVRAFDGADCLARFCTPLEGTMVKDRPRFFRLLRPEDLEKMKMPDKFVQEHLTESSPSSQNAIIFSRLGKFWRVDLERAQMGLLRGEGWSRFLRVHDLSERNILVFRYEGNMVFSAEAFLQDGRLKEYEAAAGTHITDDIIGPSKPQGSAKHPAGSPVKRKRKVSVPANKVASKKKLDIIVPQGPHHSFTKRITSYDLKSLLAVKKTFCSSVGLMGACRITLKTSVDNTKSWLVGVSFNTTNTYGYITGPGWRRFCRENKIKEGCCCTFNIMETREWHVTLTSN